MAFSGPGEECGWEAEGRVRMSPELAISDLILNLDDEYTNLCSSVHTFIFTNIPLMHLISLKE